MIRSKNGEPPPAREARDDCMEARATSLRLNLQRRKAQARARGEASDQPVLPTDNDLD